MLYCLHYDTITQTIVSRNTNAGTIIGPGLLKRSDKLIACVKDKHNTLYNFTPSPLGNYIEDVLIGLVGPVNGDRHTYGGILERLRQQSRAVLHFVHYGAIVCNDGIIDRESGERLKLYAT